MKTFFEFVQLNYRSAKLKGQVRQVANILANLFTIPARPIQKNSLIAAMKSEGRERFRAHEVTEQFWLDSRSPLHAWLDSNGVQYSKNKVPSFAEGGVGRAYMLGDFVVKMTSNRVEANVANMVKSNREIPTPVIDVLHLGRGIYGILQNYVETDLPEEIKTAADYLTMIIDDYPEMEGFPASPQEQKRICIEIIHRYDQDLSLLNPMLLILDVLIKLYKATGFKHDDAGPTNIAMYKDKVVIPDLGPNETGDFDPNDALNKIQQNRQKLGLPPQTFI